ncbi:hypothetical protein SeMB42_g03427 [Synchytrium endobioticum]|uniref:UBC core domain-containing protein n=1 Tax=Synchytrium endobioticum TaxID=286115 RepID=A0A507D104_9FUNG|nr:hypothetical protein SeLEV6574_g04151 [Synchytrium endobioticum]TPX47171.1 hypothetical protein SeMB42_g03427 [Synchytrium endobioticum]
MTARTLSAQETGSPAATPNNDTQKCVTNAAFYQKYFKRYELLIEFKNLQNHGPSGIYVMPNPSNIHEWYGVLFLHRGFYAAGVFKFLLKIPLEYPQVAPTVTFLTDVFHPLITPDGSMHLGQLATSWRPRTDSVVHVLKYVKESFKEVVLASLEDQSVPNKDSLHMFKHERPLFAKLAAQCATLSTTDSILYDSHTPSNPIRFSPIRDEQIDEFLHYMNESMTDYC